MTTQESEVDVLAVMDRLNGLVAEEWTGIGGRDLTGDDTIAKGERAHADLSGEVRELVEVVQALERACDEALIVNTYYEDEVGALSADAKSALDKLRHKERT